jgi:hypothetical protein
MVDSRTHIPLLLRLVLGMPVTYWEEHHLRLGDTKEEGGLEEGGRDPPPRKDLLCLGTDPLRDTWA